MDPASLAAARKDFSSERIDDEEMVAIIASIHSVSFPTVVAIEDTTGKNDAYILEPHSALASPHPSLHLRVILFKARIRGTLSLLDFSGNSTLALSEAEGYSFRATLPESFIDLEKLPRRVQSIGNADKSRLLIISAIV